MLGRTYLVVGKYFSWLKQRSGLFSLRPDFAKIGLAYFSSLTLLSLSLTCFYFVLNCCRLVLGPGLRAGADAGAGAEAGFGKTGARAGAV